MHAVLIYGEDGVEDVIGPFDFAHDAEGFAVKHKLEDYEVVSMSSPDGYEAA